MKVIDHKQPVSQVDNSLFSTDSIKKDFPILERKINGHKLVYLDNAATTQKPQSVIDAISSYYTGFNANVHRGLHTLAEEATSAMERTREKTAAFIGGVKMEEIIFTRNATESINMVATSWGKKNIKQGDRIVITQMEHHANLVPWIMLAKETGAELGYIPIDKNGYLDLSDINKIINPQTKVVALTHMSNVLGTINPVEEIIELAHKNNAYVLVDGAQSAPHLPINVKALDADFYVFSAHKMLGPTGVGVLYAKEEILNDMEPVIFGGEMISHVTFENADWAELPMKHEAGTPNIADIVAFAPALDYLTNIGMDKIRQHEIEITSYGMEELKKLDYIRIFGPDNPLDRGGVISFVDNKIHPHDLAQFLDSKGVAIRAGHHCAQPLVKLLGVPSTARASFYIYNTKDEVDKLVEALKEARRYFVNG
ncbi:MAG: cysteine desulfurase [candidate division Zixibacteria bacterium]|nr:cysteine desulfurase [candidate division Zixibacteria bacterium]